MWQCHSIKHETTENAGPEFGVPKNNEWTKNAGMKMRDQMTGVENTGTKKAEAETSAPTSADGYVV